LSAGLGDDGAEEFLRRALALIETGGTSTDPAVRRAIEDSSTCGARVLLDAN
jgi:hypothetical protein